MIKNNLKLIKATNILHRLGFKDENVMIVGSMALNLQGLLNRDVHDIDFIIRMDDTSWKYLKLLSTILGNESTDYYTTKDNVIFKYEDIIINIWKAKNPEEISGLKWGNMYVKPAGLILKVKKEYGRTKDIQDINDIVSLILNKENPIPHHRTVSNFSSIHNPQIGEIINIAGYRQRYIYAGNNNWIKIKE